MSRREALLSALAVFAVALAVRAVAAALVVFPIPEDTAYYAGVARNLVEGRGLVSDALWSYQTQPLMVPRDAFEVWLPLPTLLAAVPVAIAGTANWFRATQVVSVLAGTGVAVLAWRLGADVAAEMRLPIGRARTLGVGTGLVAALLGPLVVYGALPDSTAPFALLSLAACLVMTRIAFGLGKGQVASGRSLAALGAILGLAALTRSEAIWLALAWLAIVWRGLPKPVAGRREAPAGVAPGAADPVRDAGVGAASKSSGRWTRLRPAIVPGVVAGLVFAPWAIRNWLVFGNPLPGQTVTNALYKTAYDVYSYHDQPTLAGYLAQGPAAILGAHLAGLGHDVFNVLIFPGFPIGLIGLVALPRVWRLASLRPLVLAAVLTFVVTTLAFPVSTQSGTYMHAAGATLVLLVVGCMAALDGFIAWVGRLRHWTRPVAWLGPVFALVVIFPITVLSVSSISGQASDVRADYDALPAAMTRAGVPLTQNEPVITNFPVWLAESARVRTIALPEEPPDAVLDLARRFGARLVVVSHDANREWPDILNRGGSAAGCFKEVTLTDNSGAKPSDGSPLAQIRVFRIVCP